MYITRSITDFTLEMLEQFRSIIVSGPRQSGKTTFVKEIAKKQGFEYYTFDDETILEAALSDPVLFVKSIAKKPSVIDEIQMVPDIINALKITIDENGKNGLFLLTGSADLFRMSTIKESLAGRMVSLSLYPFSMCELYGCSRNIIDALFDGTLLEIQKKPIDIEKIAEHIVKGGFANVQNISDRARELWFETYIDARIEKDLALIKRIRSENRNEIEKQLRLLGGMTCSILKYGAIAKHLSIKDMTVKSNIEILESLFLLKQIRPYFTNRGKREIKAPKIAFIDTGMAAYLAGIDTNALLRKREILGGFVENFVFSELLKHATFAKNSVTIYHYRDSIYEVDLVLEKRNLDIIGIEVKSSMSITKDAFKGLVRLAQNAKEHFKGGYLFYAGEKIVPFSLEGFEFWALPLSLFFSL